MSMRFTTDDLCLSYLDNFIWFDRIKERVPNFRMVAFAIGNNKNDELLVESNTFKDWFERHKDWVEIAVHSYDHQYPPDGDRDDEKYWIEKALKSLRPFLPERYGYRSAGWQTTNKTVPILKSLGFSWIAYESKIVDLETHEILERNIINTHIYDVNRLESLFKEVQSNEVF